MNFPSHIFFNGINHGYRAAILKSFLWLLLFYVAVATYTYYKKGAQNDAHCNFIVPP